MHFPVFNVADLRSELNAPMNNFKTGFAHSGVNYGQMYVAVVFELNNVYSSDPGMIAPEDYLSPDNFIRRDAIKDRRALWSKMLKAAADKMN